jgi:fucose permease
MISGFFLSVMYPIIMSLALNSVSKHHGSFAGILMTGIMGGAVVQLIIGFISDFSNLKIGMMFIFIPLAYILSLAFWSKPIISNKTVKIKDLLK